MPVTTSNVPIRFDWRGTRVPGSGRYLIVDTRANDVPGRLEHPAPPFELQVVECLNRLADETTRIRAVLAEVLDRPRVRSAIGDARVRELVRSLTP